MLLRSREDILLPIDSTARRGEDDPSDAVTDAIFEEPQGAQHVDLGVEVRLPDRAPYIHLGGLVAEGVGPELFEEFRAPGADVPLIERGPLGNVLAFTAREVVHDGDF